MMNLRTFTSLTYLAQIAFLGGNAQHAYGNSSQLKDTFSRREILYVGGQYTNITASLHFYRLCVYVLPNNRKQDKATSSTTMAMIGQIYVEKLSPNPAHLAKPPLPIIFIAGAAQTGTNFLDTPDGRPGWASYFLDKGHTVYLTDQPARGRSFWLPGQGVIGTLGSPSGVSDLFTDGANNGDQWPQAKLHTQWPGTGRIGDATFDAFYRSQMQFQTDRFIGEEQNAQAYSALVDLVGDCYIIGHSQASQYGMAYCQTPNQTRAEAD
jgi:pimeloyl-ACP methyl ester carboxylesterase